MSMRPWSSRDSRIPARRPRRGRRIIRAGAALVAMLVGFHAYSCEDAAVEPESPIAIATVEVAPPTATLETEGATIQLLARARAADGRELDGRSFTWSTSAAGVTTVSPSGLVTAVGPGTATITATAEGRSGVATITVASKPVASVTVNPPAPTLVEGASVAMTATARDAEGNILGGRTFVWSSSNPAVAQVDAAGNVTALAAGTAAIRAASEGVAGQTQVTVVPRPVATVEVTPKTATVEVGASAQLSAKTFGGDGVELVGRPLAWSSANTAVASVDATGRVTGIAAGTVTITATSEGKAGTAVITVVPAPVASVVVIPAAAAVAVGATAQLTAQALDAGGNPLSGRAFTWTSSDPSVAAVNESGTVTGISPGAATITATSEGKSGTAAITVVVTLVASVTVVPASATIQVGAMAQLSATLRDSGGNVLTERPIAWSSSNPAIANVDANGKVTGLAPGTVTVTATAEGKSGSAVITVVPVPVATVVVTPANSTVQQGQSVQLAAQALDGNGTPLVGKTFTWASSNPLVATVDPTGKVAAVAPGTVTITATSEGKSGTATVTVVPVPVATVVVTPATATVEVGKTLALTAQALGGNGNPLPGKTFTWTTSDAAVAAVDQTGKVTAVAPGTATITATSEGKSGSAAITVVPVPVASVVITPATVGITVGGSAQLTAQALDGSGSPIPGKTFTWATSDSAIAKVDQTGKVTAVSLGTVTITAATEGKSGTATVTVLPPGAGNAIACGDLVSGDITAPAEVDVFKLSGQAGHVVAITIGETAGFGGSLLAANVTLFAPGASVVTSLNSNSQQIVTLPMTGEYTVRVQANNLSATGSYNLGVDCLFPAGAVDAVLAKGSLASGDIVAVAKVDVYTLDAQAGDRIAVTVGETGGFGGSLLAANVTLFAPDQSVITGLNSDGQQIVDLPLTGTYVVKVNANNITATGGYNLDIQGLLPAAPVDAVLAKGSLVSGSLSQAAQVDVYAFDADASDRVGLTVAETSGFGSSLLAANVTLFAPDGTVVTGLNSNGQQIVDLPLTGTYVVKVNANNFTTTGGYNLDIQGILPADPVDGTLVCNGSPIAGSISAPAKVDFYTFTAQTNAVVTLVIAETGGFGSSLLAANATLFAPNGGALTSVNSNGQVTVTLPASGTYMVKVNANNFTVVGSYNLSLQCLSPTPDRDRDAP